MLHKDIKTGQPSNRISQKRFVVEPKCCKCCVGDQRIWNILVILFSIRPEKVFLNNNFLFIPVACIYITKYGLSIHMQFIDYWLMSLGYDQKGVLRTEAGNQIWPNPIPVLVLGTGIYFLTFRFRSIRNQNFKSLFRSGLHRNGKLDFTGFLLEFNFPNI